MTHLNLLLIYRSQSLFSRYSLTYEKTSSKNPTIKTNIKLSMFYPIYKVKVACLKYNINPLFIF